MHPRPRPLVQSEQPASGGDPGDRREGAIAYLGSVGQASFTRAIFELGAQSQLRPRRGWLSLASSPAGCGSSWRWPVGGYRRAGVG